MCVPIPQSYTLILLSLWSPSSINFPSLPHFIIRSLIRIHNYFLNWICINLIYTSVFSTSMSTPWAKESYVFLKKMILYLDCYYLVSACQGFHFLISEFSFIAHKIATCVILHQFSRVRLFATPWITVFCIHYLILISFSIPLSSLFFPLMLTTIWPTGMVAPGGQDFCLWCSVSCLQWIEQYPEYICFIFIERINDWMKVPHMWHLGIHSYDKLLNSTNI